MILSSCHHDIVIICNESMYISFCLALPCLVLSCLESTSITIVIIGMTLYELVLHYSIISYHTIPYHTIPRVLLFYLFCWFDLHSILFYFTSNWFYSIEFDSILLNLIYYIVQYCISYQWMICVCPSVCLSILPSVCLSVWISLCLSVSLNNLCHIFQLYMHII